MTRNKYGHHEDAIPSDNEGKNNLVHSSSHHSSKKSCARTNRNQIIMKILPTDDPTYHVHGISFGGASIFVVPLFIVII